MPDAETGLPSSRNANVTCWACHVLVEIPLVLGTPAQIFKCGWCGAICDQSHNYEGCGHGHEAQGGAGRFRWLLAFARWGVVGVVFAIVASVLALGVTCTLPRVCDSYLSWIFHALWTAALTFNVLFHYSASMLCSPGTVRLCMPEMQPAGARVPQGAYKDFLYCTRCNYMKPPRVYHCRICEMCVVDMDHHCPFINNCVGRANLRNFLLFLFWTVVSAAYISILSGALVWKNYPLLLFAFEESPGHHQAYYDYWFSVLLALYNSPLWLLANMYLVLCGIALMLGIGFLLCSQARYVYLGMSYITSLKGTLGNPLPGMRNFSEVFGSSNALLWLLPRWGPPAGVLLGTAEKKRL